MTPIPDRPGWYLSSVNRHQDAGRQISEVGLTWFAEDGTGQGDTLTFNMSGYHPGAVMIAEAVRQIDLWAAAK